VGIVLANAIRVQECSYTENVGGRPGQGKAKPWGRPGVTLGPKGRERIKRSEGGDFNSGGAFFWEKGDQQGVG